MVEAAAPGVVRRTARHAAFAGRAERRFPRGPHGRAYRAVLVGVAAVLLCGALPAPVLADVRLTGGVEAYESFVRIADDDWRLLTSGVGSIALAGTGSRNVRGELALSVPTTLLPLPQVDRAYLRFRLPWFRSTLGAAPLSWGEGLLLNVADLPNPAYDPAADVLTGDYRTTSVWQGELYVPLGALSFLEVVALPPLPDPTIAFASLTGGTARFDPALLPETSSTRVGARLYLNADAFAIQAGYLREEPFHRLYASVQGALGADLYLAIAHEIDSTVVATTAHLADELIATIAMSGGAIYVVSLPADRSLALRVEGEIRPADLEDGLASGAVLAGLVDLTFSPTVAASLLSIVHPTEPSTLLAPTLSWNLDQGLTLLASTRVGVGAADATYATDSPAGVTVTVGARYVF